MSFVDRGALRRLGLIFLAWTGAGLFYFTQDATRNFLWHVPIPWWRTLVSWIIGVYLIAALTPAILWLGRRFPFERQVWLRRALIHLALSFVFSLVHLTLDSAILTWLG
ncbi:MAG TPA: hypothetical protein VIJ36_15150, partial [Thermoanaerobaculia bacterium]